MPAEGIEEKVESEYLPPSRIALDRLRVLVEADEDISEPFRSAFLEDLKSASPGDLANLRQALTPPPDR
jgi:hypothetical protein